MPKNEPLYLRDRFHGSEFRRTSVYRHLSYSITVVRGRALDSPDVDFTAFVYDRASLPSDAMEDFA